MEGPESKRDDGRLQLMVAQHPGANVKESAGIQFETLKAAHNTNLVSLEECLA